MSCLPAKVLCSPILDRREQSIAHEAVFEPHVAGPTCGASTAMQTVARTIITGMILALLVGIATKLKISGGGPSPPPFINPTGLALEAGCRAP